MRNPFQKIKTNIDENPSPIIVFLENYLKKINVLISKIFRGYKDRREFCRSYFSGFEPIENYEEFRPYLKMLNSAFKNKSKNIAITGPYGSGKSSIIKTYEKNQKFSFIKKRKFFYLSLAAFSEKNNNPISSDQRPAGTSKDEGKPNNGFKDNSDKQKLYRELEKSILQQLFYKLDPKAIPFSRFNKISNHQFEKLFSRTLFLTIFVSFIFLFISPEVIDNIQVNFNLVINHFQILFLKLFQLNSFWILNNIDKVEFCFHFVIIYSCLILYLIFALIFTFLFRFVICRIKISKLGFGNAEITLEADEGSAFNKYLDEILYFFEVTNYDVVVIEDLDRFNDPTIFIKFRELNFLINNSEKINRTISFIYTIGDSLFKDEQRTKFFDFIVPVIPVINSKNSGEKLLEIISRIKLDKEPHSRIKKQIFLEEELSKKFIYKIGFLFSDMRILIGSLNEFLLYREKINLEGLNSETLFSLMLYKNTHSKDFDDLQKNDGILFKAIIGKEEAARQKINDISHRISEIENEIDRLENEHLNTIDELKSVFWYKISHQGKFNFDIHYSQERKRISDGMSITDINFELLETASEINFISKNHGSGPILKGKELKDKITPFLERFKLITDNQNNKINQLRKEKDILFLEEEKIIDYSLQQYLEKFGSDFLPELNDEENKTILFFLREGYIREDYQTYISNFYPGRLSKADQNFISKIFYREDLDFSYKLDNPNEIINDLENKYFSTPSILNFDLIEHLLILKFEENDKLIRVIYQLKSFSDRSLKFLDSMFLGEFSNNQFISIFCSEAYNFWDHICCEKKYPKEKLDQYIVKIFENVDIDTIQRMENVANDERENKSYSITKYLNQCENFFQLASQVNDQEKVFKIISKLRLELTNIDPDDINNEIFDYVVKGTYYQINPHMLSLILHKYSKKWDGKTINYTAIQNSELDPLIDDIDANIETYLVNVYYTIDKPGIEDEIAIKKLLNLDDLDLSEKQKFINTNNNFELTDFDNIEINLWTDLLMANKITFSYDRIFEYYEKFGINETLAFYIDENLSSYKEDFHTEKFTAIQGDFFNDLLQTDHIDDISIIIKKIFSEYKIKLFEISNVPESKFSTIITFNIIKFSIENYTFLKDQYLNFLFNFVCKNMEAFLENIQSLDIDKKLFDEILLSGEISEEHKLELIEYINSIQYYPQSLNVKSIICALLVKTRNQLNLSYEFIDNLLNSEIDTQIRVKILVKYHEPYKNNEQIKTGLQHLGGKYEEITKLHKRPLLKFTEPNEELAKLLEARDFISSSNKENKGIRINTKRT